MNSLIAAKTLACRALAVAMMSLAGAVWAHGDVVPQVVNTEGLPKLGEDPLTVNPYRKDEKVHAAAAEIGASAYNQNCARCHGLGAVSGGIAPDLRLLPPDAETDEYFQQRIRNGVVRNGVTYMPPFEAVFNEEAIWAIRSYLDTVHVDE